MTDYHQIYRAQSEIYDRMVSCEDYEGNLLQKIQQILPLSGLTVVELGAGTGRVTGLLQPSVKQIFAFDLYRPMLMVAQGKLKQCATLNWSLAVADNRWLPVAAQTADLVIAGWSLAHSISWYPNSWQEVIGQVLAGIKRALKPGGTVILIETLGTGRETPKPPALKLEIYYRWLGTVHGFNTTWIRTDYLFQSAAEAAELTRFFFGDNMADGILAQQISIVPECTGIWWLTLS